MEKTNRSILLFEDNQNRRDSFLSEFKNIDALTTINVFDENDVDKFEKTLENKGDKSNAVEEELATYIKKFYPDTKLLLVDHDLTGLNSNINEPVVTTAGRILNQPVCRYHRSPQQNKLARINLWKSLGSIYAIELDNDDICNEAINVYDGFEYIKNKYEALDQDIKLKGPAASLANILGMPGLQMYFLMYTSAVSIFNDIIFTDKHSDSDERIVPEISKRVPFVIGYWLYNVILRYPGVILNEIATRSYLDFDNMSEAKDAFDEAIYIGPFDKIKKYWFRDKLDLMLDKYDDVEGCLQEKGVNIEIKPCMCSIDKTLHAGYYDILRDMPISSQKSKGNLTWVPQGADLARIDTESYDRLAPLVNW